MTGLLVFFGIGEIIVRLAVGNPLITEPDENLFWKYKKNQIGYQKLYSLIEKVDKNGFRFSGTEFDHTLPSIYVGGDSFAWGEGVLDSETFSSQLQEILYVHRIRYNVLNGGVPGYGIEQIINKMETECKKYNPRYAIFLWVEGDINRLRDLSYRQKQIFIRDYKIRSMFRYSAFLKMIKEQIFDKLLQIELGFGCYKDRNRIYENTHSFDEKIEGLTPKIKENVYFLKNRNITPIWVFMTIPSVQFKDYLISLSKEMSVMLIDPEAIYRKQFSNLNDMHEQYTKHFQPEVYRLLAKEVYDNVFILRRK